MSAASASGVCRTPCTMSVLILPALRAARIQSVSPIEPSGPGVEHVEHFHLAGLDGRLAAATRRPGRCSVPTSKPRSRAPRTFGASTAGILNFVFVGCGFSRCRQPNVTPPVVAGDLLQHEQLFERRVRRRRGSASRRAAGRVDGVLHGDERVGPRRRVARRPRAAGAAAAAADRFRPSDSRSGRCRTSSSC